MQLFRKLAMISTLFALAGCQVPKRFPVAPWTSTHFTAPDGSSFPYTKWLPKRPPRAVVLALHGLGGAASDWQPLGEHLQKRGLAVYAHELRGMGNDPQRKRVGHLDRRRGWFEDFGSFALRVQAAHPEVPIYWYGESLGGIIGTHLLEEAQSHGLRFDGFILASPIVRVTGKLPLWQEWALWLGARVAPPFRLRIQSLAPADQPPPQVVSTTTHEAQLEKTPHAVTRFSLKMLDQIRRLVDENRHLVKKNQRPILVLYAGNDVFTPPEEVEEFFGEIGGIHKESKFYPEAYHLLLHDTGRAVILQEIEKWLEQNMKNWQMGMTF